MHVVAYKILAHLYSCLKNGEQPNRAHYGNDGDLMNINEKYWVSIIKELVERGYVDGFSVTKDWAGNYMVRAIDPRITMDGVEFLQENQ